MRQWHVVALGLSLPCAVVIACLWGQMRHRERVDNRVPVKPPKAPPEIIAEAEAMDAAALPASSTEQDDFTRLWNTPLPGVLAFMGAMFVMYFAPSIVASFRKHHNATAIFFLNLLLGWTFLGWVGALIWALTSPPPAPKAA